jgi:hypothetical protein
MFIFGGFLVQYGTLLVDLNINLMAINIGVFMAVLKSSRFSLKSKILVLNQGISYNKQKFQDEINAPI